jgi:integrase
MGDETSPVHAPSKERKMSTITVKQLEQLKPAAAAYMHTVDNGLRVKIAPDGTKTFFSRYYVSGNRKEKAIGVFGTKPGHISLADARAKNGAIKLAAKAGRDLLEEPTMTVFELKAESDGNVIPATAETVTVNDLYEAWFPTIAGKHGRKGRKDGGAEAARLYKKHMKPFFGNANLGTLTKQFVIKCIAQLSAKEKHRLAVHVAGQFRQMILWALQNNPFRKILLDSDLPSMHKEDVIIGNYDHVTDNIRMRFFSDEEIPMLFEKMRAGTLPVYVEYAIKIMLGTAARVGELSLGEWTHIDLENGIWSVPDESTKNGLPILINMSPFVKRQFEGLRRISPGKYLFPQKVMLGREEKPINTQTIGKHIAARQSTPEQNKKIARTADYDGLVLPGGNWRCHDLRRTAATLMQKCGVSKEVIHACMNHNERNGNQLDKVYLQYDYQDEMNEAWDKLGAYIETLTGPADETALPSRRAFA